MAENKTSFMEEFQPFWKNLWPVFAVIAMAGIFYHATVMTMANTWLANETYSHGFIILPITLWLLWQHRFEIALARAKTDYRIYPLLLLSLLVWMLSESLGIQALAQFALVSSVIFAIWTLTGISMGKVIFFPVVFLLFMVPVGDFLIPPMMEFTATFTVNLLRLTGIPVFREGMFFTIPSGNWSVVEACSGVRYIIASFVLGVLYAFLNYRSVRKQIIFILFSLAIPILANGLRAYMIVMIGHLSNMELATGVDHLVYGWVFFGVVMLILFALGAIWRDDMTPPEIDKETQAGCFADRSMTIKGLAVIAITLLLPVIYLSTQQIDVEVSDKPFIAELKTGGWRHCDKHEVSDWRPGIVGASAQTADRYCKDNEQVSLFLGYYPHQKQGNEAANQLNSLNPAEGEDFTASKIQSQEEIAVSIEGQTSHIEASVIVRHGQVYRVWRWYRIGSQLTSNTIEAKLFEAYAKLVENRGDALFVVIATPVTDSSGNAKADRLLQDYTDNIYPLITAHADSLVK